MPCGGDEGCGRWTSRRWRGRPRRSCPGSSAGACRTYRSASCDGWPLSSRSTSASRRAGAAARWRGGELGRLLNDRHAMLHGVALELLERVGGWARTPEVSFNVWGERGIVDIVAWHAVSRTILLVEIKTELVDPQELVGVMDRRRRLGREISASLGWDPLVIATWVVLADTRTNRRHLARHARLLRSAFPADGRTMARWLRSPAGRIDALSFLPYSREARASRETTGPRRIRHAPGASPRPNTVPRRPRDGNRVSASTLASGQRPPGAKVSGSGCRVQESGCRVPGAGKRVPGAGDGCRRRVPGAGCRRRYPGFARPSTASATIRRWIWFVPS